MDHGKETENSYKKKKILILIAPGSNWEQVRISKWELPRGIIQGGNCRWAVVLGGNCPRTK